MFKCQMVITFLTALVVLLLGLVHSGDTYGSRKPLSIEAGMTLQEITNKGMRIGLFVGHSGERYSPSYEVSAFAVSNTHDPISEIEDFISKFGNEGFGRASNDLYVAFVGDPYLRLFQVDKPVGGRIYDRTLKIGNVVESKPIGGAPFRIGRSLRESYIKFLFVQNSALDESWEYSLGEARRGDTVISLYIPKYKATNIDCWFKQDTDDVFEPWVDGVTYEPSAPLIPDVDTALDGSRYKSWAFPSRTPRINYENSLKSLYDDGLQVSLVLAPTDEAASWMPGEPFTLTAFAAGKDYYTTNRVLNHMDTISSFVPGVRFITVRGDSQGRLFQLKKHWNGEWVIDRVQDKSTGGAPFELVGRLRQGDSQHPYFGYHEIKFVPWYTAEKGRTWAAYIGYDVVPVSYAKGISYTAAEELFQVPL